MATHTLEPTRETLHACFGLDLPEYERDPARDTPGAHALCGPIAVRGARPGDVLEVRIEDVQLDAWGWMWAGPGRASGDGLGLDHEVTVRWPIDTHAGTASDGDE